MRLNLCTKIPAINWWQLVILLLAVLAFQVYHILSCSYPSFRHPYLLKTLSRQSQLFHTWLEDDYDTVLIDGAPPIVVHYLWCRKGHFEFKHYLSILSSVKKLRPEKVVFYYHHLPVKDVNGYVTWFEDLQRDIPFLELNEDHSHFCKQGFFNELDIRQEGLGSSGVYISDEVAVLNLTRSDFINHARSTNGDMHELRIFLLPTAEPIFIKNSMTSLVIPCHTLQDSNRIGTGEESCVHLTERLSPPDIWSRQQPFYRFARSVMYGTSDIQLPKTNDSLIMPLHCHILHTTDSADLDIVAYASIISALNIAKMEHVFLHSEALPTGALWDTAMSSGKVTFIPVTQMKKWHPQIGDMLYGAYVLLRHGGVVVRSNTIWRKEFVRELRTYSCVATLRRSVYRIVNYSVDLSILVAQAGSEYLKLLIMTLKQSPVRYTNAKSEEVAYRAYMESPTGVKLESVLMQHVVCDDAVCRATAEDAGAMRSFVVEVNWKNHNPKIESVLLKYKGHVIDEIKTILKGVK